VGDLQVLATKQPTHGTTQHDALGRSRGLGSLVSVTSALRNRNCKRWTLQP